MTVRVVAAIIRDKGRILITRRPANVHLAGLWEFPGGKVEDGESLEAALIREIQEEIDVTITIVGEYFQTKHDYPGRSVQLHFLDCTIVSGEPRPLNVAEIRWVLPAELQSFDFPDADRELIEALGR